MISKWLMNIFKLPTVADSDAATVELESTSILENALDAVVGADEHNRIIFWNVHAETIFGWSKKEMLGKDMTDYIVPNEFRERHRAGMSRFIKTGISKIQNMRIEIPGLRRSGEVFPMELTVSSVLRGGHYRFYSFMRDVSDQKRTLEQLKQSAIDLKVKSDALENSLNGFDIVNHEGKFIYVNRAYLRMWGYDSTDEVIGTSPVSHCADPSTPMKIIAALKATGECDIEFVARRKDGSTFDARMLAFLAHDPLGNEIYPTTSIDITEQKQTTARLQELANSMPQLAWMARPDGHIHWYNDRWYDYTGTNFEEMEGWGWEKVHHPDHIDRVVSFVKDAWKKPESFELTFPLRSAAGEFRWFLTRAVPLKNAQGEIVQWFGTNTDINDVRESQDRLSKSEQSLKVALAQLLVAKEDAERANELKSAFLANMSHEIRTPLGALLGFADLLRDPGLSRAEQASYVDILMRNGQSLSSIINDILDLSKVEAGHLTLEYADCSPEDVAQDVISLLRVKAKEKDLVLDYAKDESSSQTIVTDALRMRQILLNLVSNAIKFTQFGTVRLKSYSCKTDDGRHAICFEVSDSGIGIPVEHQARVFEMFVQGDGSMARRFGGTGLGLSLSRRLARALGGDVELVKSEVGKGTTFLIKIVDQVEMKNAQTVFKQEPAHEPKADALLGLRILVVDDSPDNQSLIWHYLSKKGALVDSAENGLVGYKKALRENFDLVLMDIQMPEMDGYTATQRLREAGYQKPIVALTAHVLSDVRQKCLNVGCTAHLPKPINPKLLISTIAELAGR